MRWLCSAVTPRSLGDHEPGSTAQEEGDCAEENHHAQNQEMVAHNVCGVFIEVEGPHHGQPWWTSG